MSEIRRYVAKRLSTSKCAAQDFDAGGLPCSCERNLPTWELVHSKGQSFHVCEYHIEVLWDTWLTFRNAVRDAWPVKR